MGEGQGQFGFCDGGLEFFGGRGGLGRGLLLGSGFWLFASARPEERSGSEVQEVEAAACWRVSMSRVTGLRSRFGRSICWDRRSPITVAERSNLDSRLERGHQKRRRGRRRGQRRVRVWPAQSGVESVASQWRQSAGRFRTKKLCLTSPN